jgi:7,8-dihydroneopterin aldolase/epimerase/oxygenase
LPTADRIELRGLVVLARCGVLAEEIDRAQPIEIDVDVTIDLSRAGRTDGIDQTVDYGALCTLVVRTAEDQRYKLMERLAARIAEVVLAQDERLLAVTVAVRKQRPPVPHRLATAGVCITRMREHA